LAGRFELELTLESYLLDMIADTPWFDGDDEFVRDEDRIEGLPQSSNVMMERELVVAWKYSSKKLQARSTASLALRPEISPAASFLLRHQRLHNIFILDFQLHQTP